MPKEVIKEWRGSDHQVEVRWGPDHFNAIQLGVDLNQPFEFIMDNPEIDSEGKPLQYTGLWITLNSREDVDALIKVLHRAKRKTFK